MHSHLPLCPQTQHTCEHVCMYRHTHKDTHTNTPPLNSPPTPLSSVVSPSPWSTQVSAQTCCHHDDHSTPADGIGICVHGVLQLHHPHGDLLPDNQDRGRQVEWVREYEEGGLPLYPLMGSLSVCQELVLQEPPYQQQPPLF